MTGIVQQFQTLEQAIKFAQQSHRVTGQNIANLNTPGYQAQELPFEQLLARLNGQGATTHSPDYQAEEVQGLTVRTDGNNVDLDRELASLKKNALAYQTLTQLLGSKMGILKQSING